MHHPTALAGLLTPALAALFVVQAPLLAATPTLRSAPVIPAARTFQSVDEEIQRALDLRNASGRDWSRDRFAEAAEKLEEALGIYAKVNADSGDEGGYVKERAITHRALVWNHFRAGNEDVALEYVEGLMDLASDYPAAASEKPSVHGAISQAARRKETLAEAEAFWKSVADIYDAYDDKERLAQLLIDRATAYDRFGETEKKRRDLKAAIEAHLAIDDFDGANWARNNLGYCHIQAEEWSDAIGFFRAALADVRAGRGLAPQSALGYNLLELARGATQGERPSRELVTGLWSIAEEEAKAQVPSIIAPERLLVAAMHAEMARVGAKRAKASADRLLGALSGAPDSLTADLSLHAAALMLDGGAARDAQDLLGSLSFAEGPVSAHLEVRRTVMAASASASLEDQRGFERNAALALDAVEALDHEITRRQSYEILAEAAEAFPKSSEGRAVQATWRNIQRMGQPGGAGGAILRGGKGPNVDGLKDLGIRDPLFELSVRDGELLVKDRLTGDEMTRALGWKVRTVSVHGMKLETFGGYVAVVDINYGGNSGAKGSRPGLSLRDMENFRPLAEDRVLYVTKTGATSYGEPKK